MQFFSRALVAALALQAGVAFAEQVPVHETAGFTLTRNDIDPEVAIDFLSQTGNATTFWLRGIEPNLAASTDSSYQQWSSDYKSFDAFYGITVKAGYKVTSITVSGEFYGELHPAQWTMPGDAGNALGFSAQAGALFDSVHVEDLNGHHTFTLTTGPAALDGEFGLAFHGSTEVSAESVFYYDDVSGEQYWLGSQAAGGLGNLTMTVNVSPVPEPGALAMLLGGLGVLGIRSRRRRGAMQ